MIQQASGSPVIPGFDEALLARLDAGARSERVRAARAEALRAYLELPAPHTGLEEWRRTDPARLPFGRWPALGRPEVVPSGPEGAWDEAFDVVVTITEDRLCVRDVTGALARGEVVAMPLDEAAERFPDPAARFLAGDARGVGRTKFEALSDVFWNAGVYVRVPDGVALGKGVLIRHAYGRGEFVTVPRLVVAAGERSRARMVEHLTSPDGVPLLAVMCKEMYLDAAALLNFVSIQDWGASSFHVSNDWAQIARDAQVHWITVNLGAGLSKMKFGSDAAGPGASAELDGVYFAGADQHVDQRTLQVHSAPHTYSNLRYKGAVRDRARSVYQGLIIAKPGANEVDAYQKNNNLVLNDGAHVDSLPGLEIGTDNLKCSHGSTIGNLNPDEIFYLRARGIEENEARKMVILGFFEEILQAIVYDAVQEDVRARIERKIGTSGARIPLGATPAAVLRGEEEGARMRSWREAADVSEFEQSDRKLVELEDGFQVGLYKVDGRYYALDAWCSHQRAYLLHGEISGHEIICPLHGARFDLRTGRHLSPPAVRPVATFNVKVEGGKVYIET